MNIPKIVFKPMSLEENIDLIKWTFFDDNKLLDIHKYTISLFPELAEIDENLSKEDIYKIIEKVVTDKYNKNTAIIENEVLHYNDLWDKYNDAYFKALSKYLNIEWPVDITEIKATVGIIPVYPRHLDAHSFSVAPGVSDEKLIEVSAHETLHFLWFKKWKELYPDCPRREYDSPFIPWQYSEMVTDPILNSSEINNVINITEKAYKKFYLICDDRGYLMENLIKLYNSSLRIEEKIVSGFNYVKATIDNKNK